MDRTVIVSDERLVSEGFRVVEASWANRACIALFHEALQSLIVLPDCGIRCGPDLERVGRAKVMRPR